jgi:hypothetical protein
MIPPTTTAAADRRTCANDAAAAAAAADDAAVAVAVVALLLVAASLVALDASLWELVFGDGLVTVVFPVTNPKTVEAAVAAGLVIMEEEADEGGKDGFELRLGGAAPVAALHEDDEEVFLVLLVDDSGTVSAEEAKVVFNVAMCHNKSEGR